MRRKIISLLCMLAIITGSCKKAADTSLSEYYIQFKANGIQKKYPALLGMITLDLSASANYYKYLLGGTNATEAEKDDITIMISTPAQLNKNTYYGKKEVSISSANAKTSEVTIIYFDGNKTQFHSLNLPGYTVNANGMVTSPAPFSNKTAINWQVTITELSPTFVKGTFSGTVYTVYDFVDFMLGSNENYIKNKVEITDGEFYFKRQ